MIHIFFEGIPFSDSFEYYSLELIIQWTYQSPEWYNYMWLNVSETRYPGSPKIEWYPLCPAPMNFVDLGFYVQDTLMTYETIHYIIRYINHP